VAGFLFLAPRQPGADGLEWRKDEREDAMGQWTIVGPRRLRAALTVAVTLLLPTAWLAACGPACAQEAFPSRPVHLLVPFPPGGAVDIVARTLGDELAKRWGQSVIIENRPGAGGTIAAASAAKSPPDGYTLILVASGHAIVAHLYAKLSYDPLHDFTPISLVGSSPNMLLVRTDSPLKSVADVIALARAKPGELSYGHAGNGTSPHLAGELLKYMTGIDIAAVPYKGGAPALNDLLGGHIPLTFNNIPESIAQVQAGSVRALGVTTAIRSPVLPDVPTIAEAGLPGYDTGVWWGVLAPAGLAPDIQAKLAKDYAEVVQVPAVRERLLGLGATPIGSSAQAFGDLIRGDYEKWGPVIKAAGIKGE
jgi:tripartite-type tricarboxylate transporter receptor subunit TctC